MPDAKPFPKSQQLARGEKRYRRVVASPKQWQALREAKGGACRVCGGARAFSLHHVVPRDFAGDDLADNLVPVDLDCHLLVTMREPKACEALCASLSDAEYAYAVGKLGESVFERVYGIGYGR